MTRLLYYTVERDKTELFGSVLSPNRTEQFGSVFGFCFPEHRTPNTEHLPYTIRTAHLNLVGPFWIPMDSKREILLPYGEIVKSVFLAYLNTLYSYLYETTTTILYTGIYASLQG